MCNKCVARARRIKYGELESKARSLYNSTSLKEDLQDTEVVASIQNAIAQLQLMLNIVNGR